MSADSNDHMTTLAQMIDAYDLTTGSKLTAHFVAALVADGAAGVTITVDWPVFLADLACNRAKS
jgi:hypothetical protein